MQGAEERLATLGIALPALPRPAGSYVAARRDGDVVYLSGQGPVEVTADGGVAITVQGKVGAEVTLEQAREAARLTGLLLLSALRAEVGSLDRVRAVLKLLGMVNCAPGFTNTPAVIDGCSDLVVEVFGEEVGHHARSAVGMAELPFGIPVEIEMIVAVD